MVLKPIVKSELVAKMNTLCPELISPIRLPANTPLSTVIGSSTCLTSNSTSFDFIATVATESVVLDVMPCIEPLICHAIPADRSIIGFLAADVSSIPVSLPLESVAGTVSRKLSFHARSASRAKPPPLPRSQNLAIVSLVHTVPTTEEIRIEMMETETD